jgi:hypothetical protein
MLLVLAALLLGAAAVWVSVTKTRPSYDAWGWMVWGRQTLQGTLNTSAAPSWKALPYLFTLPYALFGRTQMWLWTGTATAFALAGWLLGGRIAYRMVRAAAPGGARWPALVAGLLGLLAVPTLYGMWHQILIANSDPMVVTLMLAAVDLHLSRRSKLAVAMLLLATLGRPEAVVFLGLYALGLLARGGWRERLAAVLAIVLVPVGWFLVPALTSRSWFQAGNLAEGFRTAIVGPNKIGTVLYRFTSLYAATVWIAAGAGALVAVLRRALTWLFLIVGSLLWVVVEIGFAYHGWPAAPRYLMEPAAVLGVLAAATVGRALAFAVAPRPAGARPVSGWRRLGVFAVWGLGRLIAVAGAVAVIATMVPSEAARLHALRYDVRRQAIIAQRIANLRPALVAVGGTAAILRCAPPYTFVGDASLLAWEMNLNVGQIGYKPQAVFGRFRPTVYVQPVSPDRWRLSAFNILRRRAAACGRIPIRTFALSRAQRRLAVLWQRFRRFARRERRLLRGHPARLRSLLKARWPMMLRAAGLSQFIRHPSAVRHVLRRRHRPPGSRRRRTGQATHRHRSSRTSPTTRHLRTAPGARVARAPSRSGSTNHPGRRTARRGRSRRTGSRAP